MPCVLSSERLKQNAHPHINRPRQPRPCPARPSRIVTTKRVRTATRKNYVQPFHHKARDGASSLADGVGAVLSAICGKSYARAEVLSRVFSILP